MKDKSQGTPLPTSPRRQKLAKNAVRFGARELLFKMSGVDSTQIEGITETTALVILSELGPHEMILRAWMPRHEAPVPSQPDQAATSRRMGRGRLWPELRKTPK